MTPRVFGAPQVIGRLVEIAALFPKMRTIGVSDSHKRHLPAVDVQEHCRLLSGQHGCSASMRAS